MDLSALRFFYVPLLAADILRFAWAELFGYLSYENVTLVWRQVCHLAHTGAISKIPGSYTALSLKTLL